MVPNSKDLASGQANDDFTERIQRESQHLAASERKGGPQGGTIPLRRPSRRMRRASAHLLRARGTAQTHRKAPSASATPCPPAALRCSTLGEGGLNCRVRDGTGSIPASVVALAGGAPPRPLYEACQDPLLRGDPGGRMAGTA